MDAPRGTLIAFATSAGATASDGTGENGLYTQILTEQMMIPQRLEDVFINTRIAVYRASQGKQSPQEWSQLTGQFMFVQGAEEVTPEKPVIGSIEKISTYGSIELITEISGDLFLDGEKLLSLASNTKVPINSVTTGTHRIQIVGIENWDELITVEQNRTTRIIAKGIKPEIDAVTEKIDETSDSPEIGKIEQASEVSELVRSDKPVNAFETASNGVFFDDRDSKEYTWIKIGEQIWMGKNLNYNSPASDRCFDNNAENCKLYGKLYTWARAQKVCPEGWHLPSDEEWKKLELNLGMNQSESDVIGRRGTSEGGILKEASSHYWQSPNTGATDERGFKALPGGFQNNEGSFVGIQEFGYFWTSTENNRSTAWSRVLSHDKANILRYNQFQKKNSFSVRCLRD